MKTPFAHKNVDQYREQVLSLQSAYKEAIQLNKEFEEVKKIYKSLKRSETALRQVQDITPDLPKSDNGNIINK